MKHITNEISEEMEDDTITYRTGLVKTLTPSQTKVENYVNKDWSISAKMLDLNTCSLQFTFIESMMRFQAISTSIQQ